MKRWIVRPSVVVLVVLVILSIVGARLTVATVDSQEKRLLKERGNEVNLVLSASIGSLSEGLGEIGTVERSTGNSPSAFDRIATISLADSKNASVSIVKRQGDHFVVAMAKGTGLRVGQSIGDGSTAALEDTLVHGKLVATKVVGDGADRSIGFALGPPAAPAGTVIYRQTALGPLSPPRAAATAPFSELDVVLYASPTPSAAQAVVATAGSGGELPLHGDVVTYPFAVGSTEWSLQVSANRPLIGGLANDAGWIVLGFGILIALLVASVIESAIRRRDGALALYNSEHRLAENLQRSFLPELPHLDGLEVAARYLTGSADQEVGGDWYDVFVVDGDEVGVVIGDVLGHDVGAAVIMSRIQTALRAYACQGAEPAAVLDVLDEHVLNIQADRLTTLFYGVFGVPDESGARTFRFSNAGHLPPLIRYPDGRIEELTTSHSVLLGVPAPFGQGRTQSEIRVPSGAVLVLYTDGLVEVPEVAVTDSIDELKQTARAVPIEAGPEELCSRLVESMGTGERRDDVAVLAVKLVGSGVTTGGGGRSVTQNV